MHSRRDYECSSCQRVFKRLDHFSKHQSICMIESDFVPSFALNTPVLNSTTVDFEALQLSNSDSFVTDSECPVVDNGPCEISNVSRNWKAYREVRDKTKNLESIIQSLSSPIKHTVKRNLASSVLMDVIINTDSESIHETTIVTSLIDYLKELNKQGQYPAMHKTMHSVFKNKMNDTDFLKWLASKLNIRTSRFLTYMYVHICSELER